MKNEDGKYTRPKTVRFTPTAFSLIEDAASSYGVTTSEYIRAIVMGQVAHVEVAS